MDQTILDTLKTFIGMPFGDLISGHKITGVAYHAERDQYSFTLSDGSIMWLDR